MKDHTQQDLYKPIDTPQGQFIYDPDFDYYRRAPKPQDSSHLSQFGWLYVTVLFTAICYYIEYVR